MEPKIHCAYDEMVDITKLVPNPRNPNQHSDRQIELLAKIIEHQGWRVPITVSKRSGFIVRGHGRLLAAEALGLDKVPVDYQEYESEAEEWADLIADNRIAELSQMDNEMLKDLLEELDTGEIDMELTGFSLDEIENLMTEYNILHGIDSSRDENIEINEEEEEKEPITQYGDIWQLGDHLLLCGDSANHEHVKTLMGDNKAVICFTSPPYAEQREYDEDSEFKPIPPDEYVDWFDPIAENIKFALADNGCFFLNIKEHVEDGERSLYVMELCLHLRNEVGFKYIDQMIWKKPGLPGRWNNRLRNDFEPIHFFAKDLYDVDCYLYEWTSDGENIDFKRMMVDGYGNIYHFSKQKKFKFFPKRRGKKSDRVPVYSRENKNYGDSGNIAYTGIRKEGIALPSNLIEIKGNNESVPHPAMYSVKLVEWFLDVFTTKGDIIFEPFAGGGTNFIAAENKQRRCFGIEISPRYCDLIVERWERHTGKKAQLVRGGEAVKV